MVRPSRTSTMDQTITTFTDAESRDRTLYAFLAEKERRSGSRRTVEGYARMLRHFFLTVGCPPDRVTGPEAFAWAYGIGLSEAAVIGHDRRETCVPLQL